MASMHSYAACSYDDEQIAAFEWLAGRVARMLNRDREDQESQRVLEGDEADAGLDQLVGRLTDRLRRLRLRIEQALADPDTKYEELVAVLGEAHGTAVLVQSQLVEALLSEDEESVARYQALTPAQQGVARLVADGLTNSAIASRLSLTRSTVKSHVAAITRKYGMSREQAATDIRCYLRRPDAVHSA
jgi:DNA-binding CsgD family transcriptional regulator